MPGFGLTGPAPDNDYIIEAYVRFVLAVLDRLGVKHCVLGGNSFGGYVAWMTALAAPHRAQRLILVDAGGYPQNSTSIPIGFRIARLPVLNRLAALTLRPGSARCTSRANFRIEVAHTDPLGRSRPAHPAGEW
jgi:pimeloyl-ACP methyl ester carboxylesterase